MSTSTDNGRLSVETSGFPAAGTYPELLSALSAITTNSQTMSHFMHARRPEYTRPRKVRIKVGTWNVAALDGAERDIGRWLVDGRAYSVPTPGNRRETPYESDPDETEYSEEIPWSPSAESPLSRENSGPFPPGQDIGLYVVGFQEIVDISSATEVMKPYGNLSAVKKFKEAVEEALPLGYTLVAEQQLIGLLLLVYASPQLAPDVKWVSTASVGTGLGGFMGNKGAVCARLVIGESTKLAFINCHLAAGADSASLDRRNWDASQVVTRTKFEPIPHAKDYHEPTGESLGDEDFAFWFGDLNYRLEGMPGDDIRRLLMLHTRNEYDLSKLAAENDILDPINFSNISSPDSIHISELSLTPSPSDGYPYDSDDQSPSLAGTDAPPSATMPPEFDPVSLQATISSIMPHDELQQQQKQRKAFHEGWKEGPIRFLPTYKYDIGTVGVFDSSQKRRCPSWCDRILYRSRRDKLDYDKKVEEEVEARKKDEEMKARGIDAASEDEDVLFDYNPETDGDYNDDIASAENEAEVPKEVPDDQIQQEYYTAHQHVISSDHKPVTSVFEVIYDAIVPELKAKIQEEVAREFDRAENESRPTITLIVDSLSESKKTKQDVKDEPENTASVDFGDMRFAKPEVRSITIANIGRVPAKISFIMQSNDSENEQLQITSWLSLKSDRDPDETKGEASDVHSSYTIDPGDACNVELAAQIKDFKIAACLNSAQVALDDIIVLRVQDGPDHFIPVRAQWLTSAFGQSIDTLVRVPEGGVRKLQSEKPMLNGASGKPDALGPIKWSTPRELFRLTEYIEELVERALAEWEMTSTEDEKSPWQANAGWPFIEDSWELVNDSLRDDFKLEIYEALDCDTKFDHCFKFETPALHKLEVMSEVLLLFLQSLHDGVITETLWQTLEAGIVAREKSRQQLTFEEERSWVLETLSATPIHNVSFVLITSMLSRITHEIAASVKARQSAGSSRSIELPTSPKVVHRRTLSQIPEVARQQLVDRNFAAIFAEIIIRAPDNTKGRDKEKRLREDRMIRVVEVFLKEDKV